AEMTGKSTFFIDDNYIEDMTDCLSTIEASKFSPPIGISPELEIPVSLPSKKIEAESFIISNIPKEKKMRIILKSENQKKGIKVLNTFARPPVEAYDPTVLLDLEGLRLSGHKLLSSEKIEVLKPPSIITPVVTTPLVTQEKCNSFETQVIEELKLREESLLNQLKEKDEYILQLEKKLKKMMSQYQSTKNLSGPKPAKVSIPQAKTSFCTTTFEEKLNKTYSFKREAVKKMFKKLINNSKLKLPEPKYPEKPSDKVKPNYCPYHRIIGHALEDCFNFKNWLERKYNQGLIVIPKKYLLGDLGSGSTVSGKSSFKIFQI
ncbi:hypothetical protein, partial [Klebsiella pneumoniae]|uniref:hypothetical protein n=1 Tax=Klebsiella pneumoniae TaxID=573 RepID=UPI001372C16A